MNDPRPPWDPGSGEPAPAPNLNQPPPTAAPPPGGYPPPGPGTFPPQGVAPQPGYQQPAYQQPPHQPPGYQQPGPQFSQPIQERKKRKIWPWLLGFFAFLTLGIGGCSFMAYRAFTGPVDQANEFLAAIDDGDFAAAAAMTANDSSCFGENPQQVLEGAFAGYSIDGYNLNSVNLSSGDAASQATASGTIELTGQPTWAIEVTMLKEGGDWKICGFVFDDP